VKFDWDFVEEIRQSRKTGQSSLPLEKLLEDQKIPYTLKLQLPYIVFMIYVQEKTDSYEMPACRIFFRNHPLMAPGDYLGYANFFNVSSGNEVCFGNNKKTYSKTTHSLATAVEELIALYWATPFAAEYRCRHDKYKATPPVNSFLAWAIASQKPTFGFNMPLILHDKTLQQEMTSMGSSRSTSTFDRVFILPMEEQHSEDSGIIAYQNLKLVQNVVSMGDLLRYQDIDYYIDSIVGTYQVPKMINLVTIDGNQITVELTPELLSQWDSDVTAKRTNYVEELVVDDKIVKTGTIIKINITGTYEIVDKIRIARDNHFEFIMGSKFFLAIPGTYEVIDSIKAGDTELITGTEYIILNNQFRVHFKGRMTRIQNNSYNILHVFFDCDGDERGFSVDAIYNNDFTIIPSDDTRVSSPRTFRFLDQIITDNSFRIISDVGIFAETDSASIWSNNFNRSTIIEDVLTDNATRLKIPSFDYNIDFTVGDEIIIPDWIHVDLKKIWTIESFSTTASYLMINVKSGEDRLSLNYISFENGHVHVGAIRKISRNFNDLSAGTLIQAKHSGILGFPKKAINRVVSIIIDSTPPLILCENGLTISSDTFAENFNIITSTTRRIETINLNKILWHSGDLCVYRDNLYVFNDDNTHLGKLYMLVDPLFVKTGSFRSKAIISAKNHPDFIRYGILNPRLSKSRSHVIYEQLPNFVNGTTHTLSDGYYPSTISNVSEEESE